MRHITKVFKSNKFISNVILLVSGTASIQILNFLITPVITRLFDSTSFGLLGLFNSTLNILVLAAGLCYPLAIVVSKTHSERTHLSNEWIIDLVISHPQIHY